MHVQDLLQLDALDLTLLWGEGPLLTREVSGVTATDLADPERFLQPGELVLSGLVWWTPDAGRATVDRFVTALHSAGATALLAGEETHGTVPDVLVDSCRERGIVLMAVPAHTTFRAITEAVYLRQWGDLSRRPTEHHALPENVRTELAALLAEDAAPDTLLDRAFAHLGGPACSLVTATGRVIARTPAAAHLPAGQAAREPAAAAGTGLRIEGRPVRTTTGSCPCGTRPAPRPGCCTRSPRSWRSTGTGSSCGRRPDGGRRTHCSRSPRPVGPMCRPTDRPTVRHWRRRCTPADCRPPVRTGWWPHRAAGGRADGARAGRGVAALPGEPFAAGGSRAARRSPWCAPTPMRRAASARRSVAAGARLRPQTPLHAGLSGPVPAADGLTAALGQARYALAAARAGARAVPG
ncbi:PucR family transcriptional regulator ligand-binding domain-containing protein [Streptomyces lydicus]|nr:PucR family transcriptional regulator ligand-binding domain-containing protein [Streptomyces lydicus]